MSQNQVFTSVSTTSEYTLDLSANTGDFINAVTFTSVREVINDSREHSFVLGIIKNKRIVAEVKLSESQADALSTMIYGLVRDTSDDTPKTEEL